MGENWKKKSLALVLTAALLAGVPVTAWGSFENEEFDVQGGEEYGFSMIDEALQEETFGLSENIDQSESPVAEGDIAITRERFPDIGLITVVEEQLDLNGDGILSAQERDAVVKLDVSQVSVESLQGIEYFTSLEELNCRGCGLRELDLSSLVNLRVLNVSGNHLKDLDVSSLAKLEELYCDYTDLWFVDVGNCPLKTFSSVENTARVEADVLDFSKFGGITKANVKLMSNGTWTADGKVRPDDIYSPVIYTWKMKSAGIEVEGKVTAFLGYKTLKDFPDPEFARVIQQQCDDVLGSYSPETLSSVTELYLNDRPISSLEGMEYLPNLEWLSIAGAQLQEADLRENTSLKYVRLSDMPLETICLEGLKGLEQLDLKNTRIKELDASGFPNLKSLNLNGCKGLEKLEVKACQELTSFEAQGCGLLANPLDSGQNLKTLNLSDNQITQLALDAFPNLQYLDCRFNRLEKVDTDGLLRLKTKLAAPQSFYTVSLGADSTVWFAELGDFYDTLPDEERITDITGAVLTGDGRGLSVPAFTGEEKEIRFTIENARSGQPVGTCTIKAAANTALQPNLKTPKLLKAVSGGNIKISWEEVENAAGYRVYRRPAKAGGKWTIIANVPAGTNCFYHKKVPTDVDYTFTVRAKGVKDGTVYWSGYDKKGVQARAILKTAVLTDIEPAVNPVISWKKVTGVHGYRVYRREAGKSWVLLKEVSDQVLNYTDQGAVPGITYIYTVRGHKKIDGVLYRGSYDSKGKKIKTALPQVILSSVQAREDAVTVIWEAANEVDGYQIHASDAKDGTYTLIHQAEHPKTVMAKDTQMQFGKNAYYKVCAYKRVKGKIYCGSFSDPKQASSANIVRGAYNFSEYDMAYQLSEASENGFDRYVFDAGSSFMAAAYLARWGGPVGEAQVPYPLWDSYVPGNAPKQYHVQDILFLPWRQNSLDNQEIKKAVVNYGGVNATYASVEEYYSGDGSSYCFQYGDYGVAQEPHAITIVGWDDHYPKESFVLQPEGDGAFLCKNSWSEKWGDEGFFYISYYDDVLARESNSSVFTGVESAGNYDKIYQYDPLGAVATYGYEDQIYQANVFPENNGKLASEENLRAVSFYTYDAGYRYEVYVVKNYEDKESFKKLGSPVASGTMEYAGYHTVKLASPEVLSAGSRFAVVVKLFGKGMIHGYFEAPLVGISSKARASKGESFVSSDGRRWWDMQNRMENTNACVKAFTDVNGPVESDLLRSAPPAAVFDTVYDCKDMEELGFGVNPDFFETGDWTKANPLVGNTGTAGKETYPSRYSLIEEGRVTRVQNQGSHGLCWAFGAYGSLESCSLPKNGKG